MRASPRVRVGGPCSRDMLVGWVLGWRRRGRPAATIRVRRGAPGDARGRRSAIAHRLMSWQRGLRSRDPRRAGRLTYHAISMRARRSQLPPQLRGTGSTAMSLGISRRLRISGDPEVADYLHNDGSARDLPGTRDVIHRLRIATNFSNYNMAYTGAWSPSVPVTRHAPVRTGILSFLRHAGRDPAAVRCRASRSGGLAASAHGPRMRRRCGLRCVDARARDRTLRAFPSPYRRGTETDAAEPPR
jgi:hypothetical protein